MGSRSALVTVGVVVARRRRWRRVAVGIRRTGRTRWTARRDRCLELLHLGEADGTDGERRLQMEGEQRLRRHDGTGAGCGCGCTQPCTTADQGADARTGSATCDPTDECADSGAAYGVRGGVAALTPGIRGEGIGRNGIVLATDGERSDL